MEANENSVHINFSVRSDMSHCEHDQLNKISGPLKEDEHLSMLFIVRKA